MTNPTIETAIWMALKGRVQTLSLTPAVPIIWPASTTEPTGAHIAVMNIVAPPERVLVGSGPHERVGTLQLFLKQPLPGLVYEASQEIAGRIAEHFPVDQRMSFGGVCVRVTEAPAVSDGFRDAGYWHTPVRIRWRTSA